MDDRKKQDVKERLQEYVEQITERSKGANMYICPICGSGKGRNHTGAFSIDKADPTRWKCFSCGRGGDIFDLIGEVENIKDPKEQFIRAEELLGLTSSVAQNQPRNERVTQLTQVTQQPEESQLKYFKECRARLSQTNYLQERGISEETAQRFWLGYDPNFYVKGGSWKALIIPTGAGSYTARNIDNTSADRVRNRGRSHIFNIKGLTSSVSPIFIVEGAIDALSIIEIGGEAVALGGTSNYRQLAENIADVKPAQPLILALDKDEAGERAEENLARALDDIGQKYYRLDIYGNSKDANEALLADKEEFIKVVREAEEQVKELEEAENKAEAEAYYNNTSAEAYLLTGFTEGINASVNTPATPTGFSKLDDILDGGLYEGLYIIGAISSLGKTTFALQIADQIAQSGRDTLIISLEMAKSELLAKSISRLTLTGAIAKNISTGDAKTAKGITIGDRWKNYTERELKLIGEAMDNYRNYAGHIFILEGVGDIGAREVREAVERHIKYRGEAPIVIVDYVQILAPQDVRDTERRATDKNIVELKRISRDYKTPVIGISSVNRANYKERISFEALKESGGIEYGSDIVIGLQLKGAGSSDFDVNEAKKRDPREIEAVILKNRNGQTGDTIEFLYYPKFNYFKEYEATPKARTIF